MNKLQLPIMPGTRLLRIELHETKFIAWLYTKDYVHGTFLELHHNGDVDQVTVEDGRCDVVPLYRRTP